MTKYMLCVLASSEKLFNIKCCVFSPPDNSIHLFPSLPLRHCDESGICGMIMSIMQLRTHLNIKSIMPI